MELETMYQSLGISPQVLEFAKDTEHMLKHRFELIDSRAEYNQLKVIKAMQDNKVSDIHFAATTGYGYNDLGRDTLEAVYASVFRAESALARPQLISGTHALHVALSGNLRPGDELLSPNGKPYDTLEEVIGIRESPGSLKEYGVTYRQVDLLPDGTFDFEGIGKAISEKTKLMTIQRSKGYATRPTFSVEQIGELIGFAKKIKPDLICMVDNCYGEFVETMGGCGCLTLFLITFSMSASSTGINGNDEMKQNWQPQLVSVVTISAPPQDPSQCEDYKQSLNLCLVTIQ